MDMDELELPSYEMNDTIIGNENLDHKSLAKASKATSYKASVSIDQGKRGCTCFTSFTCFLVL